VFSRGVEIKTPDQIAVMREAGLVVGQTLEVLRRATVAGVTTGELDALAHETIRSHGATSNFLGYGADQGRGFPGVICTSVNEQVVHGIPGSRVLRDGDVVSIDCGAIVGGWHGDAAITVAVGAVPDEIKELMRVTEQAMWRGIAAASIGGRVGDISAAVESYVLSQGEYGIVEGYTGHGIGSAMHQPPDVPNVGGRGRGPKLVRGLALAVEPMVTLGSAETRVLADDWTVVTTDGSWSAHFEHSFALTESGIQVLTALDGGASGLAALE
jgi:methionyl aminopeptidase